jgi:flagellar hook-basal body complex protein FliE
MGDLRIAPIAPPTPGSAASSAPSAAGDTGFGEALSRALSEVNEMQLQSRDAAVAVASGKPVDTAQMVVGVEKAAISLQFAIQVRNKLLEAYQELMRMQV